MSTWPPLTLRSAFRASAKAGDARAQYLEWVAELMASADEGEKDEWYNRLHYGDQVKLDRRQENLERARSHRGAQALSYADRSVPLPQLLCRKLESTWRDQLEEF